jgi:hypothetical protein
MMQLIIPQVTYVQQEQCLKVTVNKFGVGCTQTKLVILEHEAQGQHSTERK